jgi:hypothetical protein
MQFLVHNFAQRTFTRYRKKSKNHRPFWGDFTIHEVQYIHRQPSSNDHCGFYVIHYMHSYTDDHFGSQLVCMKWFHIKIRMFLCHELPNLSSIILLCLIFFTELWVAYFWIALIRASSTVRPGPTGLRTWPTSYRIRGATWPTPYTSCNYCSIVELLIR